MDDGMESSDDILLNEVIKEFEFEFEKLKAGVRPRKHTFEATSNCHTYMNPESPYPDTIEFGTSHSKIAPTSNWMDQDIFPTDEMSAGEKRSPTRDGSESMNRQAYRSN